MQNNQQNLLAGWIFILLIIIITAWITANTTNAEIPWPIVSVIGTIIAAAITVNNQLNLKIREEQREQKVQVYSEILDFFFDVLFRIARKEEQKRPEEMRDFFQNITPKVIMWASNDVVKNIRDFRICGIEHANSSDNQEPNCTKSESKEQENKKILLIFERMLVNIRKDLGYRPNQEIQKEGFMLSLFVNDINNNL